MTDHTESPLRRRRQRVAIIALGIVVVLWGVDTLARIGAEFLVAREIQNTAGLIDRPDVDVRGLVFLPQVIRGSYGRVDITTRGITQGPVPVDRLESQLFDLRVPFRDVLARDVRRVAIARSVERATLGYPALNAYLEESGRSLQLGPANDGGLELTGSVDVAGQPIAVRTNATLSVTDGGVSVTPGQNGGGANLGQLLAFTVPVGELPFGHQLRNATPKESGIELEAQAEGVVLQS